MAGMSLHHEGLILCLVPFVVEGDEQLLFRLVFDISYGEANSAWVFTQPIG